MFRIVPTSIFAAVALAVAVPAPLFAEDLPKSVRNGALDADDLADFLGISAYVFEYQGGRPRCRLMIEETGQKTVSKEEVLVVEETSKSPEAHKGKILFFLRQSDAQLRIHSGASRGGAGMVLPPEALWWGWKSFDGSTSRLETPTAPKPGEEIVLLRHETEEGEADAKDPKQRRKVVLTLKLTLEAE